VRNKGITLLVSICALAVISSCGKYNYIKPISEQEKKDHPEIYGDVGGDPLQTKNTYATNPAAQQRSAVLKQLLFDENARGNYIDTAKAMKSMQE
jgi:hypothetical protein